MEKICIVTTRHISYNPRVLKEADSLSEKGYEVVVVTVNNNSAQRAFDEELMKERKWLLRTVDFRKELAGEKRYWLYLSLKQRLFRMLSGITLKFGIAERAAEKSFDALTQLAVAQKASLYIAHHPEALGVGYKASRAVASAFAFDIEDLHTEMNGQTPQDKGLIGFLEARYLPFCRYYTAASKGFARAYAEKYKIKLPTVILNVFPGVRLSVQAPARPVKFYWYSQVIGPNRGLETLIAAAGKAGPSFEIHLRGSIYSAAWRQEFGQLISDAGIDGKVFFHEPVIPERLIAEGNQFDVGLALELNGSVSSDISVTNKFFAYLMSGLALIATDTYGQKDMFEELAGAGRLCRMNDADTLAEAMRFFIDNPDSLYQAKAAARRAAETKFNWEKESEKLVDIVKHNLS